jgi:tetratricopeptide (TPR) repeat protein
MQFGTKTSPEGIVLDYDFLYRAIIRPAIEELGFQCRRLDDFTAGAIWHKTMISEVISSDLLIADITTGSANVFYELGIRHALRKGRTILISGGGRSPADIGLLQVIFYKADNDGRLTGSNADDFRDRLQSLVGQSQRTTVNDSPVYDFFPELEVDLPTELQRATRRRVKTTKSQRGFAQTVVDSPDQARGDLEQSEAEVRSAPEVDPSGYLNVMKGFRDLSDWDRVIALADDAPPELATSPELRQLLSLALNRRGRPEDQERAISIMEQQIAETGGDSESYGILGRIYKDRYDQAKKRGDDTEAAAYLEKAIHEYREGFNKNPRDYYPGINVVNLLLQRGDDAAREELKELVPRVTDAVQLRLGGDRLDFWDLATDLQLALIARDWSRAVRRAKTMVAQSPAQWMLVTTLRDLHAVGETFDDENDKRQLESIFGMLQTSNYQTGGTI